MARPHVGSMGRCDVDAAEPRVGLRILERRRLQHGLRTVLLVIFFCGVVVAFWLGVVDPAREAARHSMCENRLLNLSHACVSGVWLQADGDVARVVACPICDRSEELHGPIGLPIIRDSAGQVVRECDLPTKIVERARQRWREHRSQQESREPAIRANPP
jgi:hypothetical protein